jgi:hypothetical protein
MVMDFMNGGDLSFHLRETPNEINENSIRYYMAEIVLAI